MSNRRLIEEYLPTSAIGEVAVREKVGGRIGHISGLHIWWARRPLAAARAAAYATLVDAPASYDPGELGDFFANLCRWGAAETTVRRAHEDVLRANDGDPPRVLDMFAGGGALPLEAARLGSEATALELNPVAYLVCLATLNYPQRFGPSLAHDVDEWGRWFVARAREEVGHLYPDLPANGHVQETLDSGSSSHGRSVPIAYLWTRTVVCPNPAERPHTVPLVRQTWLVKKRARFVALRIVPDRGTMRVRYEVAEAATSEDLHFDPAGFSRRGSTTCPLCGAAVHLDYIKTEALADRMDVELMAAALLPVGGRGRAYVGSDEARALTASDERLDYILADLANDGLAPPAEEISPHGLGIRVPLYGMTKFADLFTRRQLALLLTLCKLVRESHREMLARGVDPERATAIATYLALLVDRTADFNSALTTWHNLYENVNQTFARQVLPIVWDFPEANPFAGSSGDLQKNLSGIVKVIETCAEVRGPGRVVRGDAAHLPFEDASFDAIITDPPYYDNVGYADLSDFFYVWLKRSIGDLYPEHFSTVLTPKRSEIIAAPDRHDGSQEAKAAYESMMSQAFAEARRVLAADGLMVCVYAHQTTAGWATLIDAVRRAGFLVVEAWPLDTELPQRARGRGSAALASSIFLVARPRLRESTGDWAHEVRPELQQIVADRVVSLSGAGVTGTDLVIACIGAGMRAYTRHLRVEKPNGEELGSDEYLEEVEREVAEAILERIFETDRTGLGRVDQETQFYVIGRFEFGDAFAPWDELNTLARGTGVELREVMNGDGSLLAFGKKRSEARLCDYHDRGGAIEIGRSTIDHLHRVLWLAENDPAKMKDYLEAARPDPERLRLVTHALSRPGLDSAGARGAEADACERLLGVWKRLVEDNLFTSRIA